MSTTSILLFSQTILVHPIKLQYGDNFVVVQDPHIPDNENVIPPTHQQKYQSVLQTHFQRHHG